MQPLTTFITKFQKLKVDRSRGTPAPHKPILLISIIQSIAQGEITENKIYITPELVARFKDNWHVLVNGNTFTANFALPFYHLKTSGFWHLQTKAGREILLTSSQSIRSFAQLIEAVAYAWLDDELYSLLLDAHSRDILQHTLIATYFPNATQPQAKQGSLFKEIEGQILHENPVAYRAEIAKADEEEVFVRGGVFKKVIPRIYNYTCCISGMRITASKDVQMIDACHIIPFSESHDDTITNGISLCPNLHRAFDRHLISIGSDYRVSVSPSITEEPTAYSLKAFEGKEILLPNELHYRPSVKALTSHYSRFLQKH